MAANHRSILTGLRLTVVLLALGKPATAASPGISSPADAARWQTQCIECPKDYFELGDRSFVLDVDGHTHRVRQ